MVLDGFGKRAAFVVGCIAAAVLMTHISASAAIAKAVNVALPFRFGSMPQGMSAAVRPTSSHIGNALGAVRTGAHHGKRVDYEEFVVNITFLYVFAVRNTYTDLQTPSSSRRR